MSTHPTGKIFFFSGPSGVGKGTLIRALKERHPDWVFPPSCTTRAPRPGEKEGETYFFVSKESFQKKKEAGEFLEWAEVHEGNLYGTLKAPLLDPVKNGKIVIREFDVQGFASAREKLDRAVYESFFIRPDKGVEQLIDRIHRRAPMSDEELHRRIISMKREFEYAHLYDHQIYSVENKIPEMIEAVEEVIKNRS
jgi:guanylate kinase